MVLLGERICRGALEEGEERESWGVGGRGFSSWEWHLDGRDSRFLFVCFVFLGPHLRHMEVPKPGVDSELQPPVYTTATAMPDPS